MIRVIPLCSRKSHLTHHPEGWICSNCEYKFRGASPVEGFVFHFERNRIFEKWLPDLKLH